MFFCKKVPFLSNNVYGQIFLMNANAKVSPNFEKIRGLLFFDRFSKTPCTENITCLSRERQSKTQCWNSPCHSYTKTHLIQPFTSYSRWEVTDSKLGPEQMGVHQNTPLFTVLSGVVAYQTQTALPPSQTITWVWTCYFYLLGGSHFKAHWTLGNVDAL